MIAIILLVLTCDIGDGVDRRTTIGHCLAVALSHQTVTLALGLLAKSQHVGDVSTIISAAANIVSIGVAMLVLNVGGSVFRQIWP
ncbi:hypothetical protein B0I73DRAFT_126530 [Yarrowia lipolytica]|uniref:YALI0F07194p n=2 Tax=Yarrowia lipolytica TaxID=4952 RepID=Q6C2K3_YARLI|nr:YALI0F07194p [Yarrowia lipolytica CLIB122]AOW06795.1 hypothetical protein YALI1_F10552g [Yarrowia lipolytica]KAB8284132.1 hypothetical protein BKA91DRAFT_135803 [Yarrowia lipolytica]KAE8168924.1 hypothetical protein BKA90DRAFT_143487 [Yarrowia lipolytica]RDW42677.1 hypothetical protein B0I73DRAFT_126530 [Yarrowia lipolytica]RMI97713.1 hypothetical protein BD777DRAFT_126513 [Yarrowia lipolytica]|eukprot:XP_505109.1 YALI0F07194p [Yarrowia lipolytica CLIB122]